MTDWTYRECSIEDCQRPVEARGWCKRHYQQWRKAGDPQGSARRSVEERFWSYVDRRGPDDCWPWTGSTINNGYGLMYLGVANSGRKQVAHRYAYELLIGPIPEGMTLDHLCHTAVAADCRDGDDCPHRTCVNPAHLEPVTGPVNSRRGGHAVKTHCPAGHTYDAGNTRHLPNGYRECIACRLAQKPPKGNANALKTHCKRGHEFTSKNTRAIPVSDRLPKGGRACKACERLHDQERRAAKRAARQPAT